jgi:hypothetical protein
VQVLEAEGNLRAVEAHARLRETLVLLEVGEQLKGNKRRRSDALKTKKKKEKTLFRSHTLTEVRAECRVYLTTIDKVHNEIQLVGSLRCCKRRRVKAPSRQKKKNKSAKDNWVMISDFAYISTDSKDVPEKKSTNSQGRGARASEGCSSPSLRQRSEIGRADRQHRAPWCALFLDGQ